jgi:hypothetical protein
MIGPIIDFWEIENMMPSSKEQLAYTPQNADFASPYTRITKNI